MNEIQYLGETLWPGYIGHFTIILSFVAALFAGYCYYFSLRNKSPERKESWKKLGRIGFSLHGLAVFTVIGILFYAMYHQMYEYNYVFSHVSPELPMRYILSAFWEGQEGSFLLWMFWHVILGLILIFRSGKWEAPVMLNFALIEVFIASMLLGIHIPFIEENVKIGSNPTLLLRDVMDAPIFANEDYLSMIEGSGLNALLQNYWMTIHPPTLFLGFASVAVPFSYAMAGLWTKQHKEWLKPVLKWSAFSAFILGLGILMGGAWAYEALSFGGYWAWDPVENTSLVPWIILLAGLHTNLVARKTGYSIKSTYIFYILSFVLILYSTFLTRSGVLGDTSAHAFTQMGLEWQLLLFILFFLVLGFASFFKIQKSIIQPKKEEHIASKEFWMFIGALVLFFSAILIISSTSLPVYNKIVEYFNPGFQGKVIEDPISHYNKYQLWIAVFIGILSGGAQFLRFKAFNWSKHRSQYLKHVAISVLLSIVATYLFNQFLGTDHWAILLLLFSASFTIVSNLDYFISYLKGNLKLASSVLSHVGFGILIFGILATGLKNSFISTNPFAQQGIIDEESLAQNIALIKGEPFYAQNYWITYEKDTVINRERKYQIRFQKVDDQKNVIEEFKVYPNFLYNKEFTKAEAFNPDTKHYLHKDIFTVLAALPNSVTDIEAAQALQDSLKFNTYAINPGDTIQLENCKGILESVELNPKREGFVHQVHELAIGLRFKFWNDKTDRIFQAMPILGLRGSLVYQYPDKIDAFGLQFKVDDSVFDQFFSAEDELSYQTFQMKEKSQIQFGDLSLVLEDINRNPDTTLYTLQKGDLGVSANVSVKDTDDHTFHARPIFIVRNSQVYNVKDYIPEIGLHIRFVNINPVKELMEIRLARDDRKESAVRVKIAENVPRTDIIYLEAQVFPWINLVWLGSLLMLIGLLCSMLYRINEKQKSVEAT